MPRSFLESINPSTAMLLRADGVDDLPSLSLGSVDKISELMDVVACGFPLGRALSIR